MRVLPRRLRLSAWSRLYSKQDCRWDALHANARLQFAPTITMELVPGDLISSCIALTGLYDLALTRRVMKLAKAGGTFVDIGANLGYFSLLWAAANPANRCIAFEPSPRILPILRRNVARNGLDGQVRIVPVAAGRARGKHWFDVGPDTQTGWGGLATTQGERGIEVDVMRLDQVLAHDDPIALLKVDTEGADLWALMGGERLLRARAIRQIYYEQNKSRIRELGLGEDAAQHYLRDVGYVPRPETNAGRELVDWSAQPH